MIFRLSLSCQSLGQRWSDCKPVRFCVGFWSLASRLMGIWRLSSINGFGLCRDEHPWLSLMMPPFLPAEMLTMSLGALKQSTGWWPYFIQISTSHSSMDHFFPHSALNLQFSFHFFLTRSSLKPIPYLVFIRHTEHLTQAL